MRVIILNYAIERHLKKGKGFVYAPIEGCPCAYKEMCTYEKFINLVLKKDTAYLSNPRSFDDLMKFMKNYETDEMPLQANLDLASISLGMRHTVRYHLQTSQRLHRSLPPTFQGNPLLL
eukprot:gene28565-biopygen32483